MHSVHPAAHLNQSEAGPITADELNTEDLQFQDGASLDLDYFTEIGSSSESIKERLIRDSLYVKFDPIVGAIVSNTVDNKFKMPLPPSSESQMKKEEQSPSIESNGGNRGQGDSLKTPSKSPAVEAVQKLISITPPSGSTASSTLAKTDRPSVSATVSSSSKSPQIPPEQFKRELQKVESMMQDREKYFQAELSKIQSEVNKKEVELEAEVKKRVELETELKMAQEREQRLKKELAERTKSKQQLGLVMEEYEKTISQLVAQKEEEKKEYEIQKDLLIKERDTAMQHLNNIEIAFNDVHQKYERSKTVIEGMKENEDRLKRCIAENEEGIRKSNERYDILKSHASSELHKANMELDILQRSHQAEMAKLNAMAKKAEVRASSLEDALEQKVKENQELASICDELISKVGGVPT